MTEPLKPYEISNGGNTITFLLPAPDGRMIPARMSTEDANAFLQIVTEAIGKAHDARAVSNPNYNRSGNMQSGTTKAVRAYGTGIDWDDREIMLLVEYMDKTTLTLPISEANVPGLVRNLQNSLDKLRTSKKPPHN